MRRARSAVKAPNGTLLYVVRTRPKRKRQERDWSEADQGGAVGDGVPRSSSARLTDAAATDPGNLFLPLPVFYHPQSKARNSIRLSSRKSMQEVEKAGEAGSGARSALPADPRQGVS